LPGTYRDEYQTIQSVKRALNIKVMEPRVLTITDQGIRIAHGLGHAPTLVEVQVVRDGHAWPLSWWHDREPDAKYLYIGVPSKGKYRVAAVYFGGV